MADGPTRTYWVACHNCQAPFDALDTHWCSCAIAERTLVCPSCRTCFCEAPPAYKRSFWIDAPGSLGDLRFPEPATEFVSESNPHPSQVTRPLVLLVDNEPDIRRVVSRAIQSLGFGMIRGTSGDEALVLAKQYKPDLILTDALTPGLDGREMCGHIKADPETARIRVVVLTVLHPNVMYALEAYKKFKVDEYVTKPLEFDTVWAVLQRHLREPAGWAQCSTGSDVSKREGSAPPSKGTS
jgi:CheY-like chemotaxis protein